MNVPELGSYRTVQLREKVYERDYENESPDVCHVTVISVCLNPEEGQDV